jgi:epoxide hydrolase-like predicted phosphatase
MPKADMFSMAASLKENGYRTAVLSNTEVPAMQYFLQQRYDMFDVVVFSCAEGVKKPDRKIYELTLEKLGSLSEQSVFIDDNPEYINGAKKVGINTVLFQSIVQVKNELIRLVIKIDPANKRSPKL